MPATAAATSPRILIIAWEHPGVHSQRGTALVRRIGQLARGLADMNATVTVAHRLSREDDPARDAPVREVTPAGNTYMRHAIRGPSADALSTQWPAPIRRAITALTVLRGGDRSAGWARLASAYLQSGRITRPDVIIGCFTPRAPLAVASRASRAWDVPWIADLQDPWWEGAGTAVRPVLAHWTRRVLRTADLVVQVSPEWAAQTEGVTQRHVAVARHALRDDIPERAREFGTSRSGPFTILYGGSLNEDQQDVTPFLQGIARLRQAGFDRELVVDIAGTEVVWRKFHNAAVRTGVSDRLRWLGWLDSASFVERATAADCLLVIPLVEPERRGIPSKLYDYLAYGPPVLIAGPDSGGFESLMSEWQHPNVVARSSDQVERALHSAMRGDASGLLSLNKCGRRPLTERGLAQQYALWSEQLWQRVPGAFDRETMIISPGPAT